MTTDEITSVREQAYAILDDAGYGVSQNTIATTLETIADFQHAWGEGKADGSIDLPNRVWRGIQKNGKNTRRGDLVVIDFGDIRVANFCE